MQFPFEPKAVLHKHGGKIISIERIEHGIDKPQDGRSRDYWHFIGQVQWADSGKSHVLEIAPYSLCYTDEAPEGKDEINLLMAAMNEYLAEHGDWCDGKSKHEGWYARERKVSRRA